MIVFTLVIERLLPFPDFVHTVAAISTCNHRKSCFNRTWKPDTTIEDFLHFSACIDAFFGMEVKLIIWKYENIYLPL